MNIVKRIILVCYYRIIDPLYRCTIKAYQTKIRVKSKYLISKGIRNIAIIGIPNHGNLGDHAIYVAERELLSSYFPDCHVFAVNMTDFQHEIRALGRLLKKNDILVLTGGGNLGNEYMDDEIIRRETILSFPRNQIILFPQTMYFTKNEMGEKEKEITAAIYNKHQHLTLTARDQKSFSDMNEIFTGKVTLLPDVVLTMDQTGHNNTRSGALLLLRNDVEKKRSDEQEKTLLGVLKAHFDEVILTDTEIAVPKELSILDEELKKKVVQIKSAELVITDRLHGMVFAAITETPCLVLDNYNHKVKETYHWIEHLNYIKYLSDFKQLEQSVSILQQMKTCRYESGPIMEVYAKFMQEIING